jgi:hypothetical protein
MFIIKKLKLNMRKLKGAYHGKVNLLENQEQSIKWVPLWDLLPGLELGRHIGREIGRHRQQEQIHREMGDSSTPKKWSGGWLIEFRVEF